MSRENVYLKPHLKGLNRIHIIGGPGSGKSTLARRLGAQIGAPVYELDKIAFEGPNFARRPLSVRQTEVEWIASQATWIVEGMFLGWTDPLLRAADLIIWLDCVHWSRAASRIVVRFSRGGIAEARRQVGLKKINRIRDYARNLGLLIRVLQSSRVYYTLNKNNAALSEFTESRMATEQHLSAYEPKVIRCRRARDLDLLLEQIEKDCTKQYGERLPKDLNLNSV